MTLTGWRVARRRFCEAPHAPFDGVGASLHGGRWNSPKTLAAYASSTRSLATLEYLAHIDRDELPTDLIRVSIAFQDSDVESVNLPYPAEWDALAPSTAAQQVGDLWLRQQRTLALAVPSVIVPSERNYVINPKHRRMATVKISSLEPYVLDPRLLIRSPEDGE
ncbi:MAG: RES family NAD+ phosphorylase [Candidatus Eremiobacteraeota bacterium]|nr:RES family NAD+ phosphorylase [Candidatus Eremiobacteraeota bacterium]